MGTEREGEQREQDETQAARPPRACDIMPTEGTAQGEDAVEQDEDAGPQAETRHEPER